jgi:menaquinone-dependent protoporphyrinogen oxidase
MNDNLKEQKHQSRRKFLKTAAIGTAAAAVVCVGAGALTTLPPSIEFYETPVQEDNSMEKKVLVTYASKAGSTAEVAQAIGEVLRGKGLAVDVKQIAHVKDLNGYQGVVIGSCIRMGAWLPAAVNFVKKNQSALRQLPNAYFEVCGGLSENTPEKQTEAVTCMAPVRAILEPGKIGLFAGKVDLSTLSLLDRLIAKGVGSVEGDWRDWDAIKAWAGQALPGV